MKRVILIVMIFLILSACEFTGDLTNEVQLSLVPGQDTVEINSVWDDAGAIAIDGDTSVDLTTDDTIDSSTLGTYEVIYTYNDGNLTYSVTRYIQVVDQTPPIITLNDGVDTVKVGEIWEDAGATVTDNSGETIELVIIGNEISTAEPDVYEVLYQATDSSGNTSEVSRYVTVIQ